MGKMGVAVEPVFRPGSAIGVAVGGGLIIWAPHLPPFPLLLLPPSASADVADVRLADCAAAVCFADAADGLP